MSNLMTIPGRTSVTAQLLHDLRTPLNQIIGYSEMLTEDAEGHEDYIADLLKVRAAGHRMLALIDENFTPVPESRVNRTAVRSGGNGSGPEFRRISRELAAAPGVLLVVDDDATNRDVLSRRLKRQGHRVETASNGRDALQLMSETAFDAVLLDIMMPEMDGYEVLGHIKRDRRQQHVPVIMISAIDDVQSVVRCIEAGAEDYLAKPFDPTLLRARITASLEKKRGRDRETVLYEQLQVNYQRLLELEKLRDDMRNMIVHDLRTPLTSLIVGMDMLATGGDLTSTQQLMMDIAQEGGQTLLGMINDLLDVEKMESGAAQLQYEELSALGLVNSALKQVASLAAIEETAIVTDIAPDLPSFAGDENKLSRTLVNLIANAIKFTHAGGVKIIASRDNDHIRFTVIDTGAGIPPEAFTRIFEKFGQLDAHTKVGTGLGLAFCKLAVEAHGGAINVESILGAGSTFWFTIPVAAPQLRRSSDLA